VLKRDGTTPLAAENSKSKETIRVLRRRRRRPTGMLALFTVIRCHRRGFRAYWHWKSRRRGGRPWINGEIRDFILWAEVDLRDSAMPQ
jgi:hypothetical protein